mgnify:CR=1 FL=1
MSVQFPRDSPLQLNQGIPTGGRRRPLAGEDLVKVVVSVGFTGGPQPVAFHAYAPWEDAAHSSRSLAPAVGFLVVETFRPSDEFHSPGNGPETSYEGRIRRFRVLGVFP